MWCVHVNVNVNVHVHVRLGRRQRDIPASFERERKRKRERERAQPVVTTVWHATMHAKTPHLRFLDPKYGAYWHLLLAILAECSLVEIVVQTQVAPVAVLVGNNC